MPAAAQPDVRLLDHRPEPANLWIRHTAILPPPAGTVWTDVARRRLGGTLDYNERSGRAAAATDLVYLPPSAGGSLRTATIDRFRSAGIPTLVHHLVGSAQLPPAGGEGVAVAFDLLGALLGDDLDSLEILPAEGVVVWPVLAGLTDRPDLVAEGLERLQASGIPRVVPVAIELSPAAGRRLTEAFGERLFEAVFHAGEVDPRPVARAVLECGLDFLPPRPPLPSDLPANRRVATELATIGELWAATSASPAAAQEFFRAAAWLEATHHDIADLTRENNLGIVPSLSARVVEVVEEIVDGAQRSRLLEEAVGRYVAGTP